MSLTGNMNKEVSNDRVLTLTVMDGEKPTSSTGLVDPRLFKGGNTLHAVQDPASCHWYMKYDKGAVPEALHGRFTSFPKLLTAAKTYFMGRNIEIKEVVNKDSNA